jgi:flagellar M-ring protein FliF
VSVVDNLGNVLSDNAEDDSVAGLTGSQLTARRNLEQYLARKAQDMLEKVLGPGQAIVRISADINSDTLTRTEEKFDPDGQVLRTQTKNDETLDTTTSSTTQAAGISANTSTNNAQGAGPQNNSNNHKITSTLEYEIGKTTSSTIQSPGSIRRLSAAITVAVQMEGTGAERKPVVRTPEELKKLRSIVASAVGVDPARGDEITLEELPFNDQFATDITRELDVQQRHEFWWNLVRNLAWPALGVLMLVVLLRLFQRTPVQDIPIGVPVGRLMGAYKTNGNGKSNGNGNGNGHGPRPGDWMMEPQPGVVTVDVLNRLIKENPANMTQAIRNWMNNGRTPEP